MKCLSKVHSTKQRSFDNSAWTENFDLVHSDFGAICWKQECSRSTPWIFLGQLTQAVVSCRTCKDSLHLLMVSQSPFQRSTLKIMNLIASPTVGFEIDNLHWCSIARYEMPGYQRRPWGECCNTNRHESFFPTSFITVSFLDQHSSKYVSTAFNDSTADQEVVKI